MHTRRLFHALAGAWVAGMLLLGVSAPDRYRLILQEDRIVEWGTVWLFLVAGVLGLRRAWRGRRLFDAMVALFCFFVAAEEISWGQRLAGYFPPEFFLANNFQQEANLHNLTPWFPQSKWMLMLALGCYGVLLPLFSRTDSANLPPRAGATPPPRELWPWFTLAIVLLLTYPLTLTGEWVELLAGALFLVSTRPHPWTLWTTLALTVAFGAAMTAVSGALERRRDADRIACATAEVRGLVDDVVASNAERGKLWRSGRVHKRIWSSVSEGYLQPDDRRGFNTASCAGRARDSADVRRKYGIDPWGSPYWLLVERIGDVERRVAVYSFGPNRRRDVEESAVGHPAAGDDIQASSTRRVTP